MPRLHQCQTSPQFAACRAELPVCRPDGTALGSVVVREFSISLKHVDFHGGLVVSRRRKHLTLFGRYGCIAIDELRHYAPHRFDTERKRRHVEQ